MTKRSLAFLWLIGFLLGLVPNANAVPMFARMYSYTCSTCHYPGYGQLNKFGWEFRDAGFRIPSDIGKVVNDGKYELGNYMTARFSAGGSLETQTQPNNVPIPDNASFTLGGASLFIGGPVSKNFFGYSEFGLGNGTGIFSGTTPSFSIGYVGYVTGTEKEYFTLRLGKFSNDGFAGSDRGPVGNPSITSVVKKTGTGGEVGYTNGDTRVALIFYNGVQNAQISGLMKTSSAPATVTNLIAPTSDSNNAKDISLFVNQFIGEEGLAINALIYNGFDDSKSATGGTNTSTDADWAGQEYWAAALFLSSPVVKNLDVKAGVERAQTNCGLFAVNSTLPASEPSGGFFGEVDYEADEVTPIALRCDYTTTNMNVKYTDTIKFTFGALTPLAEGDLVYMNPTYALTMTDSAAGYALDHKITDSLLLFI